MWNACHPDIIGNAGSIFLHPISDQFPPAGCGPFTRKYRCRQNRYHHLDRDPTFASQGDHALHSRDLWISIPGVGENRINTVHFFAEANDPGSGPEAVLDVMEQQFGIAVRYYARIQLNGFPQLIDAMGEWISPSTSRMGFTLPAPIT